MYLSHIECFYSEIWLFRAKCYTDCYTHFNELICLRKSIIAMKISIMPILRKDKIRKDNTAPVHIHVTQNRKSRFVGTGITIPTDSWDIEKQRVKPNTPDSQELQLQIDKKISELNRRIRKLEALEI